MLVDEIISALPSLSLDDRGRVFRALKAIPGPKSEYLVQTAPTAGATAPPDKASGDIDLCLSAISIMLQKRGLEFVSPYILKRHPGFASFAAKVPPIMRLLRKTTTNRIELDYLLELSASLLYDDLTHQGFNAVSSRLIINHFHRVPSILNKNFPGYLSAGLLGHVIKRKVPTHVRKK